MTLKHCANVRLFVALLRLNIINSLLVGALLAHAPCADAQQYLLSDLGALRTGVCNGTALNASGQVVGQFQTATFDQHGFLSSGGTMQDLGTLGGTTSSG